MAQLQRRPMLESHSPALPYAGKSRFFCGGRCMTGPVQPGPALLWYLVGMVFVLWAAIVAPRLWRATEGGARALVVVPCVLLVVSLSCFLCTACSDPGVLARAPFLEVGHRPKGRWCNTCQIPMANGVYHCARCDNCVAGIDHHCPLLGTCIGVRTLGFFYMFQGSLTCLCYFLAGTVLVLVLCGGGCGGGAPAAGVAPPTAWEQSGADTAALVLLGLFALGASAGCVLFLLWYFSAWPGWLLAGAQQRRARLHAGMADPGAVIRDATEGHAQGIVGGGLLEMVCCWGRRTSSLADALPTLAPVARPPRDRLQTTAQHFELPMVPFGPFRCLAPLEASAEDKPLGGGGRRAGEEQEEEEQQQQQQQQQQEQQEEEEEEEGSRGAAVQAGAGARPCAGRLEGLRVRGHYLSAATRLAAWTAQREAHAEHGGWCLGKTRDYTAQPPTTAEENARSLMSHGPMLEGAVSPEAVLLAQEARMSARLADEAAQRVANDIANQEAAAVAEAEEVASVVAPEGGLPEAAVGARATEIMAALRRRIEATASELLVEEAREAVLMGSPTGGQGAGGSSSSSSDEDGDCHEPVELVQAFFARLSEFYEAGGVQEEAAAAVGVPPTFRDGYSNPVTRVQWFKLVAAETVEWMDGALGEAFLEEEDRAVAQLVSDPLKRGALLFATAAARAGRRGARAAQVEQEQAERDGAPPLQPPPPPHGAAEAANAKAVMVERRVLMEATEAAVAAAQAARAALGAAAAAAAFVRAAEAPGPACRASARHAEPPRTAPLRFSDMDRMLSTFGMVAQHGPGGAAAASAGDGEEEEDDEAMRAFQQAVMEQHAAEGSRRFAAAHKGAAVPGVRPIQD